MNIIHLTFTASHEAISQRARELWLQSGEPDGQDLKFWLQAKQELNRVDAFRAINQEQLQEVLDSFDPLSGRRGPTALDLT